MVIDATNDKIVAKVPVGEGCDGTTFDASLHTVYFSNGEGTLIVIKEVSKDKFEVVKNLPTKKGARTLSVDAGTQSIYFPTADFGAPAAGERRAPMILGIFQVLVVR